MAQRTYKMHSVTRVITQHIIAQIYLCLLNHFLFKPLVDRVRKAKALTNRKYFVDPINYVLCYIDQIILLYRQNFYSMNKIILKGKLINFYAF